MSDEQGYAGDILPTEAWEILRSEPDAVLVDVRTEAEYAFVGVPDLSALEKETLFIPWKHFPTNEQNPDFAQQVAGVGVGDQAAILFLCRSGQRSKMSAIAVTALGFKRCYNVAHGFEGDMDGSRHRGTTNGWKVDGLPWVQS